MHVFIIIIIVKPNIMKVVSLKFANTSHETSKFHKTMLNYHLRADGNVPVQSVIIFGDSIIQGLCAPCISKNVINYGIGGDTTLGIIHRVKKYKSLDNAKAIILAIGVNDLAIRGDKDIITNFKKIISLLENKKLVISLILPVDERIANNKYLLNSRIHNLNIKIKYLCNQHPHCLSFNFGSKLLGNDGNLKRDFHIGDGVHLNKSGYSILIKGIREFVNRKGNING